MRPTLIMLLLPEPALAGSTLRADAGGPYEIPAESAGTLDAGDTVVDEDACGTVEYRWDLDQDGVYETDWSTDASVTYDTTGVDGQQTEQVDVSARATCDGEILEDTDQGVVLVRNVDPEILELDGPSTAEVDEITSWTVSYSDVESADTHSVSWDWGDDGTGSGDSASHGWSSAGTYTVTVTVTDDDDGSDSLSAEIVVGDGSGGTDGGGTDGGGTDGGATDGGGTDGGGTDGGGTDGGGTDGGTDGGGSDGGGTDGGSQLLEPEGDSGDPLLEGGATTGGACSCSAASPVGALVLGLSALLGLCRRRPGDTT